VNPLTELDLATLRQRQSLKWRRYPPDVLPLWVAEMDTPLAPPIRAVLERAVALGDTGYPEPDHLAEAFTGFAHNRFDWWPDPSTATVVGDVVQGVEHVLNLVTRPGDAVLLCTPAYPPFFRAIARAGRTLRPSPLARGTDGRYRLDLDLLSRDLAAPDVTTFLLVNPHNPTGLVLSSDDLSAVATLCDQHRVRVLADEIHAPLTMPGSRFVPYLTLPEAQRGIAFHAASKAWNLAGLKAALVVPGADAVDDVKHIPEDMRYHAGLFGVLASDAAFRSGGPWLADLVAGLDENRALLGSLLASLLPEVGYSPPDATFLTWLDCRGLGIGADPAAFFLEAARVAVSPGQDFGAAGAGFVRLNIGTSPQILTAAVERMAAAVTRRR
jgi:cysteine-S-conjugate beta-lyase